MRLIVRFSVCVRFKEFQAQFRSINSPWRDPHRRPGSFPLRANLENHFLTAVALSCSLARAYLHSSPSGSHNNGLCDGCTARIFDVSELNEVHVPS